LQRLTDSLQLSLLDLTRAPTSTSANPVNLGKRAILALLSGEELLHDTDARIGKLESAVKVRAQQRKVDTDALTSWLTAHKSKNCEASPAIDSHVEESEGTDSSPAAPDDHR
jgi:hypothetical protein